MPTILIVDDDGVDREQAARCLESIVNLEIFEAKDGAEALAAIAEHSPDVVVSDVRMPELDGLQLVARVKQDYPSLPVVLMTSMGSETVAVEALRAGAASYVPKDELKTDLVDTVRQVLEISESRRMQREIMSRLTHGEARFELNNDLEMISPLVGFLQGGLDRLGFGGDALRTQVGMSLMEALTNAITHGNLELDSELRRRDRAAYDALLERRQGLARFASRIVHCFALMTPGRLELVVRDQGAGFDTQALPDPTLAENVLEISGRGLWLIRTFMDEVEFNERGNEIRMVKYVSEEPAA